MHTGVRVSILLLAGLLMLVPDHGSSSVEAHKPFRSKTITRTFANPSAIVMSNLVDEPAATNPYPSSIAVDGFRHGSIQDVNLTLYDFSHTFPSEVDVLLVGGDGRNATVMSDVGGFANVSHVLLELDDEAAAPLPSNATLISGTFQPADYESGDTFAAGAPTPGGSTQLSTFDGSDPNGTWQLFVQDDEDLHTGSIAGGWSLEITVKVKGQK